MPFSSVLGASSVIKPGVCTSTTRPTVPYEGQLIYETDTDRVASYNGSAWVYTATSGLVLVKTQTIGTAVSSVTVSDVFSSTYDNYIVTISDGSASAWSYMTVQLGATTTGYYWAGYYSYYNSASLSSLRNNNTSSWQNVGAGIANSLNVQFTLVGPNLAKNTAIYTVAADFNAVGGSYIGSGFVNNTTQYTAFTIAPSSGTYTGGTIRVYGYANS